MHGRAEPSQGIPLLEWISAGIGVALVAGTIAFMAYRAWMDGASPPSISLAVESVRQVNDGYVVVVTAVNRGESTAADVVVEASLEDRSGTVEASVITFPYLPPHSRREGGFFFENDPALFELKLRPRGYVAP